ncbi:MAG TPA: S8 family serine peptidase, partial [Agromyces sp.]|nr:S8 family serine peptidase [Agromyces sp.]
MLGAGAVTAALVFGGAQPAHADTVRDLEYWLTDYGFTTAWTTSKGDGVTVAVIDTGVNGNVAELRGAVVGGTDVSGLGSPDGQTPVGDESEHGTLVASLLAGRGTGEGSGVLGVAPEVDLLTASVAFGQDTGAEQSNDDQIAEAVKWAVDNGADVINMSLTTNVPDWPESWDDAFLYAFDHDVVIVVAAGNRGSGTTRVGAPATI